MNLLSSRLCFVYLHIDVTDIDLYCYALILLNSISETLVLVVVTAVIAAFHYSHTLSHHCVRGAVERLLTNVQ